MFFPFKNYSPLRLCDHRGGPDRAGRGGRPGGDPVADAQEALLGNSKGARKVNAHQKGHFRSKKDFCKLFSSHCDQRSYVSTIPTPPDTEVKLQVLDLRQQQRQQQQQYEDSSWKSSNPSNVGSDRRHVTLF